MIRLLSILYCLLLCAAIYFLRPPVAGAFAFLWINVGVVLIGYGHYRLKADESRAGAK